MKSTEIREKFLNFFRHNGHVIVPSSSLVPDDPSVLLTTAGMQQFKRYYTNELDAMHDFGSKNMASIQKCFRTSDIEEVGDATHLTFFEMLGNFSFGYSPAVSPKGYKPGEPFSPKGGYGKREAITYAYEFVTKELQLPISYATIFEGSATVPKDDESKAIWRSLGVRDVREEGMNDVFWGPTGNVGPCGPTTEIYCRNSEGKDVEVWNIVFNQFFFPGSREELLKGSDKKLELLETPGIDTGAGFERLAMITQGVSTVYETDLFRELIAVIADGHTIPERTQRIIADHLRASIFLIADGVRPLNKEAGYILRRLLRRVIAHGLKFDIHSDVYKKFFNKLQSVIGEVYPEIMKTEEILNVIEDERQKFGKVVAEGLRVIAGYQTIGAKEAFLIYESFGLPLELILEFAPKEAIKNLNTADFKSEFLKHQEISRAGVEKKFGGHGLLLDTGELKAKDQVELKKAIKLHTATHLLQQALRDVLGDGVAQRGSDITAERLRFDFSFARKVTPEELKKVEDIVNKKIGEDLPVAFQELPKDEAAKTGALYVFSSGGGSSLGGKQKYPEKVKVYYVGHSIAEAYSKEFCGGPHVDRTGTMGKFKILKEEAVAAGVRRIRAMVL